MLTTATPEQLPGNRPPKAKCASVTLYHMDPGHHREAAAWHDADHKAEVIASVPNVFISQRWVTPPAWSALRPPSDLPEGGGEYVNIYWSSGTADELSADFSRLGADLDAVGRMDTVRYMHLVWPTGAPARLRPTYLETRPGLPISAAAVTASTAMTGLVANVGNGPGDDDFDRWYETEYLPKVLDTKLFAGAARLALDHPDHRGVSLTLLYLDARSPADAYVEYRERVRAWAAEPNGAPDAWPGHTTTFETIAQPSIGRYDVYD
ncbi:MAG: hypothetical protein FWC87_12905 [Acidimicrobiaceae bacterium]|nr:hypothetical protein [Acidimicrobiaceae bacterium]